MADQKHLTLSGRIAIEAGLNYGKSFKSIAIELGKDVTTISKEVRKHSELRKTGGYGRKFNDCYHRSCCKVINLCSECKTNFSFCRSCSECWKHCSKYEKQVCEFLKKPPYVCNGCKMKNQCTLEKSFYSADEAARNYRTTLSESRKGVNLSEKELKRIDNIVSPLLKNGQSIHHICINHTDEILRCEKTMYKYVDAGLFDAINLDMPLKVRLRPRKGEKQVVKVDKSCRINRNFNDFMVYKENNPGIQTVELDTVEGVKGGAVLLTIHFVAACLQIAFRRETNDAKSVTDIFKNLYDRLGKEKYHILFPLLLADNGSEFSDPTKLESPDGKKISNVFYCDAASHGQKGSCERNHEFIRKIIPKNTDISNYTQEDINKMMNHINSYGRPELNDKSPYEMFAFLYGQDILDLLGVSFVPRDQVILKPSLLRKEKI